MRFSIELSRNSRKEQKPASGQCFLSVTAQLSARDTKSTVRMFPLRHPQHVSFSWRHVSKTIVAWSAKRRHHAHWRLASDWKPCRCFMHSLLLPAAFSVHLLHTYVVKHFISLDAYGNKLSDHYSHITLIVTLMAAWRRLWQVACVDSFQLSAPPSMRLQLPRKWAGPLYLMVRTHACFWVSAAGTHQTHTGQEF